MLFRSLTEPDRDGEQCEPGQKLIGRSKKGPELGPHAFVRLKLALTENNPTVKPYDEKAFAELPDQQLPIDVSLVLLDGLHARWAAVLNTLTDDQFARPLYHPEIGAITIEYLVQSYGWHSRHHVAHITRLREREGW